MGRFDEALATTAVWCGRRPVPALLFLLVLTGLGSYGLSQVNFQGDVLDVLPRDDPHTENARAVQETFPFFFDQVAVYLPIDPQNWEAADALLPCRLAERMPESGLDEVYIRGLDEFTTYLRDRVPSLAYDIDLGAIVRLLNWTNTGVPGVLAPDPAAYAMPGTDCAGETRFLAAWEGALQFPQVHEELSPDERTLEVTLVFDPARTGDTHDAIGRQVIQALQDYPEWAQAHGRFQAFDAGRIAAQGLPIVDAHAADVTLGDMALLAPLVFVGIVGLLAYGFRSWRMVVAATTLLVVSFVWSTGLLGLLGIPLANLNLAFVPVILGVGLDYGIHMMNAVLARIRQGETRDDALRAAGRQVGTATSVAVLTTLAGLSVLAFSPSPMMAQVALASGVSVLTVYVLTFTWLPAVLGLLGIRGRRAFRGSRLVPAVARSVQRHRGTWALLLVVVLGASAWVTPRVGMAAFGDPELQFAKGDLVRDWHDTIDETFYLGNTSGDAFVVLRGDVQTPQAHDYLRALGVEWADGPLDGSRIAHLPLLVESYLTVRNGTAGAGLHTVLGTFLGTDYDYPQTAGQIEATLDEIFRGPFANFTGFFVQPPGYGITIVTAEVPQGDTFEEAERVWTGFDAMVAEADAAVGRPPGVSVTYFGNAAFSHLFIESQLPWINTLLAVVVLAVVVLVAATTRSWRAVVAVSGVSVGGSAVWVGLLWLLEIPLSPLLFLPVVILIAVGTDDAIHLALAVHEDGEIAYQRAGKAVTYTSLTSGLAFAVFAAIHHLGVAQSMLATVLAVLVSYTLAVVLVPMLDGPGRSRGQGTGVTAGAR